MLTTSQLYRYRTEGYVAVEGVLSPEQLAQGRAVIAEFVERSRAVTANDAVFDLEADHSPERPRVRRIKSPAGAHPFFDGWLRSGPILDLVESVLGPDIRALGSKL